MVILKLNYMMILNLDFYANPKKVKLVQTEFMIPKTDFVYHMSNP